MTRPPARRLLPAVLVATGLLASAPGAYAHHDPAHVVTLSFTLEIDADLLPTWPRNPSVAAAADPEAGTAAVSASLSSKGAFRKVLAENVTWPAGVAFTVFDLMNVSAARGNLTFHYTWYDDPFTGEGDQDAFLDDIDGLANSWPVASTFWIYFVDGAEGGTGMDEAVLSSGDAVEWRYMFCPFFCFSEE